MREMSDVLADTKVGMVDILLNLQVSATRAGNHEMAAWAAKEGTGYAENDELPTHRIWPLSIEATLHSGLQVTTVQVPHIWLPEEQREAVTTFKCRTGMGGIERMLRGGEGHTGMLEVPHPNLPAVIQEKLPLTEGTVCIGTAAKFPIGHLADVATMARQTALTWCLKCEEEGEGIVWPEDQKEEAEQRRQWRERMKEEGAIEVIRGVSKAAWEIAKQQWLG